MAFSTTAETPSGSLETSFCYSTKLAQATPQNLKYLKQYIGQMYHGGSTFYSKALNKAFDLFSNTPTLKDEQQRG